MALDVEVKAAHSIMASARAIHVKDFRLPNGSVVASLPVNPRGPVNTTDSDLATLATTACYGEDAAPPLHKPALVDTVDL